MSSGIVSCHPSSLLLTQIPDDCVVRIFELLDLKNLTTIASICKCFERIQAKLSIWTSLFPLLKIELSKEGPIQLKQCVQQCLIPLGSRETNNQCVLDLYLRTITLIKPSDNAESACLLAAQHPKFLNCSFVVYIGSKQVPDAIIKNARGVVSVVNDVMLPNEEPFRNAETIRALTRMEWDCQNDESQEYHEYKWFPSQDKPADELCLELQKASEFLRHPRFLKHPHQVDEE